MKKYILLALLICFSSIKAQNYDILFNDQTEEVLTVSDEGELIISKKGPVKATYDSMFTTSYLLTEINNSKIMELTLEALSAFTLKKGDRLFFKTTKENIIDFAISEDKVADYPRDDNNKWSTKISLPISDSICDQLLQERIKSFIFFPEQSYITIIKKDKDEFQKYLESCFLRAEDIL